MQHPPQDSQPSGDRPVPTIAIATALIAIGLLFLVFLIGGGPWVAWVVIPLVVILAGLLGYLILAHRLVWQTLALAALGLAVFGYFKINKAFNDQKKQIADLRSKLDQVASDATGRDVANFNALNARLWGAQNERQQLNARVAMLQTNQTRLKTQSTVTAGQVRELIEKTFHVTYVDAVVRSPPVVRPTGAPKSSRVKALIRAKIISIPLSYSLRVSIDGKPRTFTLNSQSRIIPVGSAVLRNDKDRLALLRLGAHLDLVVDSRTNSIQRVQIRMPRRKVPKSVPNPRKS